MVHMYRFILTVYCWFLVLAGYCQNDIAKVINLDEFVVSLEMESFDIEDFVEKVRNDTTFYKAFLNMKYFPHKLGGSVVVFEKDNAERATMKRTARQHLNDQEQMWVEVTYEQTNGKIKKKNGEWRYLTAEMYDDVFFPTERQQVSNIIVSTDQELVSGSKIEKHKAQLKRMMFNPGKEIENVPFIGDKLAIFDDHMVPYYDYAIFNAKYGGKDCIAFSCFTKEGMEKETVIHNLTSYFDPDTYEVLSREYRLAHSNILFTFDITMKVDNSQQDGWLLPQKIVYSGFWDVPFRKPEIINFELQCSDYETHVGRYKEAQGR